MDWNEGDLVWFDPNIGHPLPGEIQEVHRAAQVTIVQAMINGKVSRCFINRNQKNLEEHAVDNEKRGKKTTNVAFKKEITEHERCDEAKDKIRWEFEISFALRTSIEKNENWFTLATSVFICSSFSAPSFLIHFIWMEHSNLNDIGFDHWHGASEVHLIAFEACETQKCNHLITKLTRIRFDEEKKKLNVFILNFVFDAIRLNECGKRNAKTSWNSSIFSFQSIASSMRICFCLLLMRAWIICVWFTSFDGTLMFSASPRSRSITQPSLCVWADVNARVHNCAFVHTQSSNGTKC